MLKDKLGLILTVILCVAIGYGCEANSKSYTKEYASVQKAVVRIKVHNGEGGMTAGSGFHIGHGYIVTNHHVIEGGMHISIENSDVTRAAFIIATDSSLDLALLYSHELDMPYVNFGNSDLLRVGQEVFTIGSAQGLFFNTLGTGHITGLNRNVALAPFTGIVQINTGVVPGNSGGPLFNLDGDVMGITYSIFRGTNLGFVIPSNRIRRRVDQFILEYENWMFNQALNRN